MTETAFDAKLREEFSRTETVTEKGKKVKRTRVELVAHAQTATALKGSPIAQKNVLQQADALAKAEAERNVLQAAAQEQRREFFRHLKVQQTLAWDRFVKTGQVPEQFFPHPDDIDVDDANGRHILRGPLNDDDMAPNVGIRIARDRAILSIACEWSKKDRRQATDMSWFVTYTLLNNLLPTLWRHPDGGSEMLRRIWDYQCMSRRQIRLEYDCLDMMEELLALPRDASPYTGVKQCDQFYDKAARKLGYANLPALCDDLAAKSAQLLKKATPRMRAEAEHRLNAMFKIDVEAERQRREAIKRKAEAMPIYRKGKPVT